MLVSFLVRLLLQTTNESGQIAADEIPFLLVTRDGSTSSWTMMLIEEGFRGALLVFPSGVFAGLASKRISIRRLNKLGSIAMFTLVGELLLDLLICTPILLGTQPSTAKDESLATLFSGVLVGFRQPTTLALLALRLSCLVLGTWLGQSFTPIALTGSIATGKSTVARMLLENSEHVDKSKRSMLLIDTDRIGHEILLPPSALESPDESHAVSPSDSVYNNILTAFGDDSVGNKNILDEDGRIDRRKLGAIIFQDPTQRRVLNRITHPRIIQTMLKQIVRGLYFGNYSIVCADIPLLFESSTLTWLFCVSILVACRPDQQLERLKHRNTDLTEQQCKDRIASQIPIDKKMALADLAIRNDGTLEDLTKEVERAQKETSERLYGPLFSLSQYIAVTGVIALGLLSRAAVG